MSQSLAMIHTRTLVGVTAHSVIVEVHLANGLPSFSTVGLPEAAVKESKDRVRGAILNSGFEFPAKRITVNLAPADLPKSGSRFDLPIAIGILLASDQIKLSDIADYEFVGELALDGSIRGVSGIISTALACKQDKRTLILPSDNEVEAALTEQKCYHASHILQVCEHLNIASEHSLPVCSTTNTVLKDITYDDLADVKGQSHAKRALEIAATGGHSLLFVGPPGTGKSMLASRLLSILPDLNRQQAMQSAAVKSLVEPSFNLNLWMKRPYRSPHHSISSVAMVGGGSNPRPGEISLAHNGVLFLDELTEFNRSTLEQLREPLETNKIHIARAQQTVEYPAKFQLITACNPCKCGYLGDGTDRCVCSATSIDNYRNKLSGPLMDRIDMHVHLQRVDIKELQSNDRATETSKTVKERVVKTSLLQLARQGCLNHQLSSDAFEQACKLDDVTMSFIAVASERLHLSARAYHRILKLGRTIADMESEKTIQKKHIAEAICYRSMDRN